MSPDKQQLVANYKLSICWRIFCELRSPTVLIILNVEK